MLQLLHEQHVCALLHYGQYSSLVIVSHDGVHLEVTESFPVSFRWTLVYAHTARYYHSLPDQPMTVFQTVPAMFVEAAPVLMLVLSDDGIDGFMRNLVSHSCKIAGYLLWRPLPLFEQAYCHVADKRLELRLSSRVIVELLTPIACAISFFVHFLCSNTEIVYLCSEVSCLYISNAKLTNLEEISVSSFLFLHCLSNSLPQVRSQEALRLLPLRQTSAVFFMILRLAPHYGFCTSILNLGCLGLVSFLNDKIALVKFEINYYPCNSETPREIKNCILGSITS